MSTSNPIIDLGEARKAALAKKKIQYPVKVYCIVDDISDASRDPLLKQIREHALSVGAVFTTRLYDSTKYTNDRHLITRLPAFHVHIRSIYDRTFYPNTRPLDHINECIRSYLKEEEEKVKRKKKWIKLYQSFKAFVWRMVHRETAMERYERETYINAKKSRFENMKLNVSEWS
jgi:hypothetical protein